MKRGKERGLRAFFVVLLFFAVFALSTLLAGHLLFPLLRKSQMPRLTPSVRGFILPFTTIKNHGGMLVKMRVNHRADAYFVVDTGAAPNVISPHLVKALELRTEPNPGFTGRAKATSSENIRTVAFIERLSDDKLELSGVAGPVSNVAAEVITDKSKRIDGIIGSPVLKEFAVVFDFEKKRLLLIPGGNLTNDQLGELGSCGTTETGISLQSGAFGSEYLFRVPAQITTRSGIVDASLVIDTGTPHTMLLDKDNRLKIPTRERGRARVLHQMNCTVQHFVVPFSSFQIGSPPKVFNATAIAPFTCSVTYDDKNGKSLLGMDYLSHFQVIIDYPAKRLYLTPRNMTPRKKSIM